MKLVQFLMYALVASQLLNSTITSRNITLPATMKAGSAAWRIWVVRSLYTYQMYLVPLITGESLLGWTDSNNVGHVSMLDRDESLVWTRSYDRLIVRGLTNQNSSDGSFAVLLWNSTSSQIFVSSISAQDNKLWMTEIVITSPWDSIPNSFDIGDSRLSYSDGVIGAYYHVHSLSGHEGDALVYLNASTGIRNNKIGWGWGCSHSISMLFNYHPKSLKPVAICVSDCYPSKSISVFNGKYTIQSISGNCGGGAGAELGGLAASLDDWGMVFTTQKDQAGSAAPTEVEVGFVELNATSGQPKTPVIWLTTPFNNTWKTDARIAYWGKTITNETLYIVGWATDPQGSQAAKSFNGLSNKLSYSIGIINAKGEFMSEPISIPAGWGRRDDTFVRKIDGSGSILWLHCEPNTNQLRVTKLNYEEITQVFSTDH